MVVGIPRAYLDFHNREKIRANRELLGIEHIVADDKQASRFSHFITRGLLIAGRLGTVRAVLGSISYSEETITELLQYGLINLINETNSKIVNGFSSFLRTSVGAVNGAAKSIPYNVKS